MFFKLYFLSKNIFYRTIKVKKYFSKNSFLILSLATKRVFLKIFFQRTHWVTHSIFLGFFFRGPKHTKYWILDWSQKWDFERFLFLRTNRDTKRDFPNIFSKDQLCHKTCVFKFFFKKIFFIGLCSHETYFF